MNTSKNQVAFFQVIKAIACFSVILLHSFMGADGAFETTNSQHVISLAVKNIMEWAVPCFIMVSGALLLNPQKEVTFKKLFSKYILRMVIAILAFTIIFNVIDAFVYHSNDNNLVISILDDLYTSKSASHMWYLYTMVALYLILPLYKLIVKGADDKVLRYIFIVYAIFFSVLPAIQTFTNKETGFYFPSYSIYPLYFFAGYILYNNVIKINKGVAIATSIIALVLIILATYYSGESEQLSSLMSTYANPLIVVFSISLFAVFQNMKIDTDSVIYKILNEISNCSFGIYLIHMIFLKYILVELKLDPYANGGVFSVLILAIMIFIVTFLIVWLLKKIPYIKNIL